MVGGFSLFAKVVRLAENFSVSEKVMTVHLDGPLDKKQPDADGSMGHKLGFVARGLASPFCASEDDGISQVGKRKDFGLL